MKKLLIIMLIIQCLLVSCYDTAEKRTEKWIDKVSGKAYSYEEGNEKIWIGFSDYNFVIQSLEDENNLWGAIANLLVFIGTAASSQYLESELTWSITANPFSRDMPKISSFLEYVYNNKLIKLELLQICYDKNKDKLEIEFRDVVGEYLRENFKQ